MHFLVLIILLLISVAIGAEETLVIDADDVQLHSSRRIYNGNVNVVFRNIRVKADTLILKETTHRKELVGRGNPVTFHQDLMGSPIQGEALQIRLYPGDNKVLLTGDARLRQGQVERVGHHLEHNLNIETINPYGEQLF